MSSQITLSSQYSYTANITSYNPVTKVVTLDQPVNISYGPNSQLTGDGQAYDISSKYTINGTLTNIAKVPITIRLAHSNCNRNRHCLIFSFGVDNDPTDTLSGLFRYFCEIFKMFSGKVAENNNFLILF